MSTFYYAAKDKNGVLCVDQMFKESDRDVWTPERVAEMAKQFPETVYFEVDNRVPELRVPGEEMPDVW